MSLCVSRLHVLTLVPFSISCVCVFAVICARGYVLPLRIFPYVLSLLSFFCGGASGPFLKPLHMLCPS